MKVGKWPHQKAAYVYCNTLHKKVIVVYLSFCDLEVSHSPAGKKNLEFLEISGFCELEYS